MIVVVVGKDRQVDDGHVVNLDGFDHPSADDGRRGVLEHGQAIMNFQDRVFAFFSDKKPNRYDGHVLTGHGVDIFDAVDLPQQTFQGGRHQLFDLVGSGSRCTDVNVGQRHHDLGILFPRGDQYGGHTQAKRKDDQDDGQLRGEEAMNQRGDESLGSRCLINHAGPPPSRRFPSRPARRGPRRHSPGERRF